MAKICRNCGTTVEDQYNNCPNCGSVLEVQQPQQNPNVYNQAQYGQQYGQPMGNGSNLNITKRSIVTAIILSVVTCGIYGIYWFICLTNEVNQASGEPQATSGAMAFLFNLLTCGIYSIYWSYKMGERMSVAGQRYGRPIENRSMLYLILSIFGLGIVNYCLIQDDLNKLSA